MRAAITENENSASSFRKAGLPSGHTNFHFPRHCEHASAETPKEPQQGTSSDQINNTPVRAIEIFQKTNFGAGSAHMIVPGTII
jgi:hypothetical protein